MFARVEPFQDESFESIYAAVSETPRGRWFLAEHARRQRAQDTLKILESIKKLEGALAQTGSELPAEPAPSAAVPLKNYFETDEDLFLPAAPAKARGAKLNVKKVVPERQDLAPDAMRVDFTETKPEPRQHVVIIRQPADEMLEAATLDSRVDAE
jgi:hypothetical protein